MQLKSENKTVYVMLKGVPKPNMARFLKKVIHARQLFQLIVWLICSQISLLLVKQVNARNSH